jgi:hypothetical protein
MLRHSWVVGQPYLTGLGKSCPSPRKFKPKQHQVCSSDGETIVTNNERGCYSLTRQTTIAQRDSGEYFLANV